MPRTLPARYITPRSISDDQLADESVESRAIKNYDIQSIDLADGILEERHFGPGVVTEDALSPTILAALATSTALTINYCDGIDSPDCVSVDEYELSDVAMFRADSEEDVVFGIAPSSIYALGVRFELRFAVVDATTTQQPFKFEFEIRKKGIGALYDDGVDYVAPFVISVLDPEEQIQIAVLDIEENLADHNLYFRLTRRSNAIEDTSDGNVLLLSLQAKVVN